ncbi:kinase-like domain-containing protein [Gigaspora rosea]|uniref:Kinase-like domain-containing protein n=1 Tax=Gigaspora rosea TaxID=44941 RepID=A0A397VPZ0_9GLOM|nr:kinase-like domain-containing protein [Gigaspora rosea]
MTDVVDSTENEIEPYIIIDNIISESILNTSELTKLTNKVENEPILKPVQAKNDESEVKVDIDKNFEKDINLSKEIKFDLSAAQLERIDSLQNDSEMDNIEIEQLVQELQLDNNTDFIKWFSYEKFKDIEYLGHGGYGMTYCAKSKEINHKNMGFGSRTRNGEAIVILKHLNNSKEMINNYLNMVKKHHQFIKKNHYFVKCYGITQYPKTKEYVMVMEYIRNNDLHNCLFVNHNGIKFESRKNALITITRALASLHKEGIVHKNLHSKNILVNYTNVRYQKINFKPKLDDFGLCHPVNKESSVIDLSQNRKRNVFGVLPYIPPEVLRGEPYTTAGDIYSLGGIMYEMATNRLPFSDCAHNTQLIYDICDGLRPQFPQDLTSDIPLWFINLIYECWENDPNKRPTAQGLGEIITNLSEANASDEKKNRRTKGPSRSGPMLSSVYTKHPDAIFTSQLWPTLFELDQSELISTVSASASDKILNNNNNIKLPDDKPHLSESKDLLDVNNELEESSLLSESYFLDFKSTESFNDFSNSDNTDDTEDFTFSESDAEGFDNVSTDNDDDYDVVSLDGNEINLV